MQLSLVHAKYQFIETIRVPIAVISAVFFPTAAMIFFVVPFAGHDPVASTYATASMVTFSVMMNCLFSYGVGVAEDRAQPWDPFTRTLPAGSGPKFAGRILNSVVFMVMSLIPVVAVAAIATEATITTFRLLAAIGTLVLVAVPFTLMGLAIGYALPSKAALATAQIVFFPLAFGGGLLAAPGQSPGFVEVIAPFLPTRGAVELMWRAVGDFKVSVTSMIMLVVWILLSGALATWAYRRDEGRRFA
ncbi:ABC transporter permease [Sphaerimonospora sp. CA-214678]|uniref:ABC transporter permease n=1 Tax=Sphaerimonospora sp. CA-214678 TaxID=3240029 RepID=UPI003D927045